MKAQLSLEYIGEAYDAFLALGSRLIDATAPGLGGAVIGNPRPRKPWVAEITGLDAKWGLARRFVGANWQRKAANSAHTRGVFLWFVIESGRYYEVMSPVSWRSSDRYFCRVTETGEVVRARREEVEQWAKCI